MSMAITDTVRPLADLEATIERGLATFVEVGQALLEIREHRLYRESHDSFENYCRERWNFNRSRASQLIEAAEVSRILDTPPIRASHAEELARLKDDPEAVREVWAEVQEQTDGRPTAAVVREATDRRLGVTRPTAPARYVRDADSQDVPDLDASQDTEDEPGGLCFECNAPVPVGADECPACVARPAAPGDEPAPVSLPSTQAIRDANLGSEFLHALRFATQIAAYAPERVVAVLRMDDADATERSLERLGGWLDRYRQARAAPLRVVGR